MKIISVHGDIDKVENLLQGQVTSDVTEETALNKFKTIEMII